MTLKAVLLNGEIIKLNLDVVEDSIPGVSDEDHDFNWSESLYGMHLDETNPVDEDDLSNTPTTAEADSDYEGEKDFDAPQDVEGEGGTEITLRGGLLGIHSFDEVDDLWAATEESNDEEEEESEEDEEDEERNQDEEDEEDVADDEGEEEAPEESPIEQDDEDLDYNESPFDAEKEVDWEQDGDYPNPEADDLNDARIIAEESFEDLFQLFGSDSGDDEGPEFSAEASDLEDEDLISDDRLYSDQTDDQDDFLDFVTESAELLPFDAGMLVGESELFDDAQGTISDADIGPANYFSQP